MVVIWKSKIFVMHDNVKRKMWHDAINSLRLFTDNFTICTLTKLNWDSDSKRQIIFHNSSSLHSTELEFTYMIASHLVVSSFSTFVLNVSFVSAYSYSFLCIYFRYSSFPLFSLVFRSAATTTNNNTTTTTATITVAVAWTHLSWNVLVSLFISHTMHAIHVRLVDCQENTFSRPL